MSATAITKLVLSDVNTAGAVPAGAAVAANEGALIVFDKRDQSSLVILENSNTSATATAIVKAGNGLQGVADLSITLAASEKKCVVIESGRFKNVSGTNKGKVLILDNDTTATTLKVSCIVLPDRKSVV